MDSAWYYHDAQERRGPMPLSALLAALARQADPQQVSVWREGMADWQPAGSVAEIAGQLPSRSPSPAPPRLPPSYRPPPRAKLPLTDAETIARLYRRLVLTVGLQILIAVLRIPLFLALSTSGSPALIGLVAILLVLVLVATAVIIAVTAYRLAGYIAGGPPILWAIAMFLPCINILGLLLLSSKAQAWCRQYGIRVGFLGPSLESIEELRRISLASDFE